MFTNYSLKILPTMMMLLVRELGGYWKNLQGRK